MVPVFRTQPDARPVVQPEPSPLWLFLWHFQPFLSPYPLYPLVIHLPAFIPQQYGNPSISISTILARQCYDIPPESLCVTLDDWFLPLCRSWLIQYAAYTSF